ncbi:hypothetical protein L593_11385 [Salinarchaeum sp. Harcht-Bsk1]|uniref:hypothetical protein n=1 Tax=Salinarchaeum sp. Harcht-Bsk1 TaxID=1333523 RepID=UPI0003423513|nr:hypothetical protein [Salinarchaeum sp. Harcht-Bsk1]AGN02222.1 hypothetical protein L593_11385 [Salinarchaeum sp. Harcht-Bsk1]
MSRLLDRHAPYALPLVVGRLADTVTTLYGLRIAGIYERNAVVAALMEDLGRTEGMLVANVISIAIVLLTVEIGVALVASDDGPGELQLSERVVVEVGYLPAIGLSFAAATYNVGVIAMA